MLFLFHALSQFTGAGFSSFAFKSKIKIKITPLSFLYGCSCEFCFQVAMEGRMIEEYQSLIPMRPDSQISHPQNIGFYYKI